MTTIQKFQLRLTGRQEVEMPQGSHILSAAYQGAQLCLWAVVDTSKPMALRTIRLIAAGQPIEQCQICFIATVQHGTQVWHVFQDAAQLPPVKPDHPPHD